MDVFKRGKVYKVDSHKPNGKQFVLYEVRSTHSSRRTSESVTSRRTLNLSHQVRCLSRSLPHFLLDASLIGHTQVLKPAPPKREPLFRPASLACPLTFFIVIPWLAARNLSLLRINLFSTDLNPHSRGGDKAIENIEILS